VQRAIARIVDNRDAIKEQRAHQYCLTNTSLQPSEWPTHAQGQKTNKVDVAAD